MKAAETSSEKKDGEELQSDSGGDDDDDESGDGGDDNCRRKMIVTRASRRQQDTNISEGADGGKKEADEGCKTIDVKDVSITDKNDRKKRQPPPINNKSCFSNEKTIDKNSSDSISVTRSNETVKNENTLAVTTRSAGRNGRSVTTSKAVTRTNALPTMKSSARFKATKKKKRKRKKCNEWQMYDESGCLISTGIDMCDCLDIDCPGCHFPCRKCGSEKCGTECRCERPWVYEEVKIEGSELVITNPTFEKKKTLN